MARGTLVVPVASAELVFDTLSNRQVLNDQELQNCQLMFYTYKNKRPL